MMAVYSKSANIRLRSCYIAQHQPAADFETKEQARHQLDHWRYELANAQFEAALQRGAEGKAERVLQRILAELTLH